MAQFYFFEFNRKQTQTYHAKSPHERIQGSFGERRPDKNLSLSRVFRASSGKPTTPTRCADWHSTLRRESFNEQKRKRQRAEPAFARDVKEVKGRFLSSGRLAFFVPPACRLLLGSVHRSCVPDSPWLAGCSGSRKGDCRLFTCNITTISGDDVYLTK